jgi:hypothetical protein
MLLLISQAKIRGRCGFWFDHIVEKLRMAEEKTSAQMLTPNRWPREKFLRLRIARLQSLFR